VDPKINCYNFTVFVSFFTEICEMLTLKQINKKGHIILEKIHGNVNFINIENTSLKLYCVNYIALQ